jgi:hypothetical protein
MDTYTVEQLKELQVEFKSLKRYKEKIYFFDTKFNIIPFLFPPFSIHLPIFFEQEITNKLIDIFRSESNNPMLKKRQIAAGAQKIIFDITPTNSNNPVYNSFIVYKFLLLGSQQKVTVNNTISDFNKNEYPVEKILEYTNNIINSIESILTTGHDKSLLFQFMKVFYLGFCNEFAQEIKPINKKKKFTILYLYSLGILYARYIATIKQYYAAIKGLPSK